jgi:hypothetical protein
LHSHLLALAVEVVQPVATIMHTFDNKYIIATDMAEIGSRRV